MSLTTLSSPATTTCALNVGRTERNIAVRFCAAKWSIIASSGASVSPSPYVARKTESSPRNGSTIFSRSAIVVSIPVSTNVIVQSSMSLWTRSICRPPCDSTKSLTRASLYVRKYCLITSAL